MAKKKHWLTEGRELRALKDEHGSDLDQFYSDCKDAFTYSKRTVQDHLKIIDLVDSQGHGFTVAELEGIKRTRLRGIDELPNGRDAALALLRRAAKKSTMDRSGQKRNTLDVAFEDSVAAVLRDTHGQVEVTLAIERRAGQLVHRQCTLGSMREARAYVAGSCWSAARLVVSWPGAVERARAVARWAAKVHADLGTWVAHQADGLVRRPGAWGPKLLAGYSKVPRRGAVGGKAANEGTAAAWCSSVMGWAQSDGIDAGAADAPVERATVLLATVIALPQDLERVEASATGSKSEPPGK